MSPAIMIRKRLETKKLSKKERVYHIVERKDSVTEKIDLQKSLILQSKQSEDAEISMKDFGYIELAFPESVLAQIDIIRKLADIEEASIYFQLLATYADGIERLAIPRSYRGRVIFPQELGSIIIEMNKMSVEWAEEEEDFVLNLFWCTEIYLINADSQEVQDTYLSKSLTEKKLFSQKIISVIDVDNDGSQMKILYRKGTKIEQFLSKL